MSGIMGPDGQEFRISPLLTEELIELGGGALEVRDGRMGAAFVHDCGGVIETRNAALAVAQSDGATRYLGVPCSGCEHTFTVEIGQDGDSDA